MRSTNPWKIERGRLAILAVLIATIVVLVPFLAIQAAGWAESHRRTAREALNAYAGIAAWEYHQRVLMSLSSTSLDLFAPVAQNAEIEVEAFADSIRTRMGWCGCVDSLRTAVRLQLVGGEPSISGAPVPNAVIEALRGQAAAYLAPPDSAGSRSGEPGAARVAIGSMGLIASRGPEEPGAPASAHGRGPLELAFHFVDVEGEVLVMPTMTKVGQGPETTIAYAVLLPAGAFLQPVASRATSSLPLLPAQLTRGPSDSVVVARLVAPNGQVIADSDPNAAMRYQVSRAFEGPFGGLHYDVGLRESAADDLVSGGIPRSPLPVLMGVVALGAALAALIADQILQIQKLGRMRAGFVASVSHELRTPLAQIRLYSELLQDETMRSDDERRRWARLVDQEAQRLTFLIENVLSFSGLGRGADPVRTERFELESAAVEVARAFEPMARSRRVSLRVTVPGGLDLEADRARFRLQLFNLLDNAVKFGPVGQTITIGAALSEGGVDVWVDDAGPGIPEKDRERVWQPFARLSRPTESASGGSGVGLSIVRSVAEIHHGTAWIAEAPGGGARVGITFPTGGRSASTSSESPAEGKLTEEGA